MKADLILFGTPSDRIARPRAGDALERQGPAHPQDPASQRLNHLFAAERVRPNDACYTNTADQAAKTSNDCQEKGRGLAPSAEPHP